MKPVRLSAKDWRTIYDALCERSDGWRGVASGADRSKCRGVLRRIGAAGMTAAFRGVAPIRLSLGVQAVREP